MLPRLDSAGLPLASRLAAAGLAVLLAAACSDEEPAPRAPAAAPRPPAVEGAPPARDAGAPVTPPPQQPAGGFHLDDATMEYRPRATRRSARRERSIELVLRSTPPGAAAAVDGVVVGTTPTYWSGHADGSKHEFTFVKPGYAMARYRFVPTQSGVVHGSLEPLVTTSPDAGSP